MTNAIEPKPASPARKPPIPVPNNPVVARCCKAYIRAHKAALAHGKGPVFAALDAGKAYRDAMPTLARNESIRDFIACTAHSILIGAFPGKSGTQLLYAAQLAQSMVPARPQRHDI